jgi:epsin
LVLLEYLVTHGSERVVDEARGHISTIKVLRSFQYVDDNGKDEGINGMSNLSPSHFLWGEHLS